MKTIRVNANAFESYVPEHPERTGYRQVGDLMHGSLAYEFKVWPSVGALKTTLEIQSRGTSQAWRPYLRPIRGCSTCLLLRCSNH